jgi:transcriptional regulator with XRE-family HTH domain
MRGAVARGVRIASLRADAGLTQEALAAACDCDVKTVRSAEHSKRLDFATLCRIADKLGVPFKDIAVLDSPDSRRSNIQAVERWIAAFNAREPAAVAACFHEQGSITVLADRALPGSGEYRGRASIRSWAETCFATFLAQTITPSMYRLDAADDYVFVRVERPKLTCLLNGNQTLATVMWEFHVQDGLLSNFRVYVDSGVIERMVFGTPTP